MRNGETILSLLSLLSGAAAWAFPEYRIPAYGVMGLSTLALGGLLGRPLINRVRKLEKTNLFLLIGLGGTWVFLTVTIVATVLILFIKSESKNEIVKAPDDGPIAWVYNFSMEGGMGGLNIFSLTFQGANVSKDHVQLREAKIRSLVDGTELMLEVVAVNPTSGENALTELNNIQLIPPGAPIMLVGKFGPPDPRTKGHVLGLEAKVFLETWRQFAFVASDDKRSYRLDFNENSMMPFFKGKVGPRVTAKVTSPQ